MIELRTLGMLDLKGADGTECRSVLRQPKRLALLSYLASASPRRFHRRDALLAMFWPELDEAHARAALRRALYFLRVALGADVVVGRGEEEVGVADAKLWCDATAFGAALQIGRAEAALELYRGGLLEGFFIASAPDYQDWLDRERTRLRDQAERAAWDLAASAESAGRAADARDWARRAAALAPGDEDAARRLIELLERTGDRGRTGDHGAIRGAIHGYGDFAGPGPDVLAVFPFPVLGDERFAYLGSGVVDLLSISLDGGELRTVDPRALLAFLARERWESVQPEQARQAAARFGASSFLLGTVVEAAGQLQISASLYDAAGTLRQRVRSQRTAEAQLFDLIDDIARQLLAGRGTGPGTRLSRLAGVMTDSVAALKAYLEGEGHLRSGRYFDGMAALQRAVDEDGAFALAYYRFAAAAAGCALPALAREMADCANRHRDRLAAHDRLLLDAQRAWLHGDVAEAESHYNTITGTYPDDVEAWFLLGDLLFHSNPLRGRSGAEARGAFERALWLEPDHVTSLVHLVRIAAIEGKQDEALALAERVRHLSPSGDQALAMRAFQAYTVRSAAEIAAVCDQLQRARAITVAVAFSDVAVYSDNLDGAESLARSFIQVARSAELRALCHIQIAHLELARGRWSGAARELATAEALDAGWGIEVRALLAALPLLSLPASYLESLLAELARWPSEAVEPSAFVIFAMHNGLHPALRRYLMGLLCTRLGDGAGGRAELAALRELAVPDDVATLRDNLVRSIEARLAQIDGRPAEALAHLRGMHTDLWFQLTVASPFYGQAHDRFLCADVLRELGRDEEALGWYGAVAERSPFELVYAAPAHLRRGEIYERIGEPRRAAAEYRRFVGLWQNCDPDLQPLVRNAEERIGGLESRGHSKSGR